STPASPSVSEVVKTLSIPSSPVLAAASDVLPIASSTVAVESTPKTAEPENGADGAPATEPTAPVSKDAPVRPSPSEHSDSDFVIVTHDDATPTPAPSTAPVPPVVVPTPRVPMSFASAAARGAAIPNVQAPVRKTVPAPVKVDDESKDVKDSPASKRSKGKGERREPKAALAAAPVAIKA
ncbi:hypothetical protein P7C70_g2111, partial [Phenoliferia sp. Uapishka_3]